MFSLFNFSSIFPGESADPICPYVRTPAVAFTAQGCGLLLQISQRGVVCVTGTLECRATEP